MIEGLAMYEAGMFEGVEETIRQCIEADNIPTIGSLETMTSEEEFAQAGVFAIGYTVVEFVV